MRELVSPSCSQLLCPVLIYSIQFVIFYPVVYCSVQSDDVLIDYPHGCLAVPGKHLNTRQPPVQAKANGGGLAGWYEIQSLLYKYLGTEHVSFSHHFQGCVQEDDSVAVVFHGQPSVRAKLPIGADGYFSAVRAQCPNDGPPSFSVRILPCVREATKLCIGGQG